MNKCIDCKKSLKMYGAKRCKKCWHKFMKGKNNPNFGNKWSKKQKKLQGIITKKAMDNIIIRNRMKINHADVSGINNPMHGVHRFGKKAPCYINGEGKFPYPLEFNSELKKKILDRDNHICQKCGKKGTHVHHIDYCKQNCNKRNLITTCFKCNIKVNYDRDYWYAYFIYIMETYK